MMFGLINSLNIMQLPVSEMDVTVHLKFFYGVSIYFKIFHKHEELINNMQ